MLLLTQFSDAKNNRQISILMHKRKIVESWD